METAKELSVHWPGQRRCDQEAYSHLHQGHLSGDSLAVDIEMIGIMAISRTYYSLDTPAGECHLHNDCNTNV